MVVPPEDPEGLAAAIDAVIQDPGAAARRVEAAARRLHSHFGIERWIDAHDRVYDLIASDRDRSRASAKERKG
jgi:hypothetical protein